MADHRHTANDAWEALMTAHASLIRQFNAEDVWEDLSMKEYDVLYTLSKCPNPIRLSELNQHVLLSHMSSHPDSRATSCPHTPCGTPPAAAAPAPPMS